MIKDIILSFIFSILLVVFIFSLVWLGKELEKKRELKIKRELELKQQDLPDEILSISETETKIGKEIIVAFYDLEEEENEMGRIIINQKIKCIKIFFNNRGKILDIKIENQEDFNPNAGNVDVWIRPTK